MSSRLFKHLCKSVCEQQSYIDETVDAIAHAVFGAAVESAARFLHAQLPARIVQTMYLIIFIVVVNTNIFIVIAGKEFTWP